MSVINLNEEPEGATYLALLNFAAQHCSTFSLTWRESVAYKDTAIALEMELQPCLMGELMTDGWEGEATNLGPSRLRTYKVTDQSLAVLSRVDRLYAWKPPKFPEDLSFYRPSGECWLVSVSRDGYAFFEDPVLSADDLRNQIPGIDV